MLVKWSELNADEISSMKPIVDEFRTLGWVVERVPSCSHGGPHTIGAYLIAHLKTGMAYVGSHANLYSRPYQHNHLLNKGVHWCKRFQEAFMTSDRIVAMLLPTLDDRSAAYDVEQHMLSKFHSEGLLFNVSSDARHPAKGMTVSQETRQKLSAVSLGKKQSPEWVKKRTSGRIGIPLSMEARRNISEAAKARGGMLADTLRAATEANSIKVFADGIVYSSLAAASAACGLNASSAIKRVNSKSWPDWHYYSDIFERKVTDGVVVHDSVNACAIAHELTVAGVLKRLSPQNDFFPNWAYVEPDARQRNKKGSS